MSEPEYPIPPDEPYSRTHEATYLVTIRVPASEELPTTGDVADVIEAAWDDLDQVSVEQP